MSPIGVNKIYFFLFACLNGTNLNRFSRKLNKFAAGTKEDVVCFIDRESENIYVFGGYRVKVSRWDMDFLTFVYSLIIKKKLLRHKQRKVQLRRVVKLDENGIRQRRT